MSLETKTLLWLLAALVVFTVVAGVYAFASARIRAERQLVDLERQLRNLPEAELVARLRDSDYFDLRETGALREQPAIVGFLERLEGREYASLYREFWDDAGTSYLPVYFVDAERAIGYEGRPMIIDYMHEFGLIIKVLEERRRESASASDSA